MPATTCPTCTHGKGFNCRICWPSTEQKRHTLYGRSFAIVAEFADSDEGTREANAFMEANPGAAVLEVIDGRVILAHKADKGELIDDAAYENEMSDAANEFRAVER